MMIAKHFEELLDEKENEITKLKSKIETFRIVKLPSYIDNEFDIEDSSDSGSMSSEVSALIKQANTVFSEKEPEETVEICQYQCNYCDFKTKKKPGLKIHISRMHKVECVLCNNRFSSEEQLRDHNEHEREEHFSQEWDDESRSNLKMKFVLGFMQQTIHTLIARVSQ